MADNQPYVNPAQSADTVAVDRAALRTLLDWYDEPEHDTWGSDVPMAIQRLRLQLSKGVDPDAPDPLDLVRELREALGLFAGAMPVSPRRAWEEALDVARRLAGTREIDRDDFFEDREVTEQRAAELDWGQRG